MGNTIKYMGIGLLFLIANIMLVGGSSNIDYSYPNDPWWDRVMSLNQTGNDMYFGNITTENIYPHSSLTYDIGSGPLRWNNLYVGDISADEIDVSGDVTAVTYYGSGASLTDLNVSCSFSGNVTWNNISDYPAPCPGQSYITGLDDSVTCTSAAGSHNSTAWNRSGTNVFLANTGDKVGIGTVSPSDSLVVNGSTKLVQKVVNEVPLTLSLGAGDSANQMLVVESEDGTDVFRVEHGGMYGAQPWSQIVFCDYTGCPSTILRSRAGYLDIVQAHATYGFLVYDGSDYVGMGVQADGSGEFSTSTDDLILSTDNWATEHIYLRSGGGIDMVTENTSRELLNIAGDVIIDSNVTIDSNVFHVDTTANNVGIGTSTPSSELHVIGDVNITGTLHCGSPLKVNGGINLTSGNLYFSDGTNISTAPSDSGNTSEEMIDAVNNTALNLVNAYGYPSSGGGNTSEEMITAVNNTILNASSHVGMPIYMTCGENSALDNNAAEWSCGGNGETEQAVYVYDDVTITHISLDCNTATGSANVTIQVPQGTNSECWVNSATANDVNTCSLDVSAGTWIMPFTVSDTGHYQCVVGWRMVTR